MGNEQLLKHVRTLLEMYEEGDLGGEVMPEDVLKGVVEDADLLHVLTLAMALNYQRNSYALWESVVKAYQDEKQHGFFNLKSSQIVIFMIYARHYCFIVLLYNLIDILRFGNG